jgi:hypothetical protein
MIAAVAVALILVMQADYEFSNRPSRWHGLRNPDLKLLFKT